ncbi:MAG: site-specific DNA-methyltransferase [Candidatus Eremiobacteraeota bacterium]|nr:site-specific DNA-methyltransferase [Candidatus Eremiobacteraeota bacterium]
MQISEQLRLDIQSMVRKRKAGSIEISDRYSVTNEVTLHTGRCEDFLQNIPERSIQLVVTSPPYNIGKHYERGKKQTVEQYIAEQRAVIELCAKRLSLSGSICWQVGNHVVNNELYPIDIMLYPIFRELGLVMRNRVIWHFEHGLHCGRRLSGRYETIMWFTWPGKEYTFNLDAIRVPQKYPGKKYFKGPKTGQYSANPLGKNPGDLWVIPNVKHNHVEKTNHPCQFPVELVERLVLALSNPGDLVVDPYMGAGSTAVAAFLNGRRAAGADITSKYVAISKERLRSAANGTLRTRPIDRAIYVPTGSITIPPWNREDATGAIALALLADQ